jgi:esterase/lipase superfamily enzyme
MVSYRENLASIACLLMLGGCAAYPLMPTRNIYAGESGYPENQVPEALKSDHVDLLYVTDRSPEFDTNEDLSYGSKCSDFIAFGSAMIERCRAPPERYSPSA